MNNTRNSVKVGATLFRQSRWLAPALFLLACEPAFIWEDEMSSKLQIQPVFFERGEHASRLCIEDYGCESAGPGKPDIDKSRVWTIGSVPPGQHRLFFESGSGLGIQDSLGFVNVVPDGRLSVRSPLIEHVGAGIYRLKPDETVVGSSAALEGATVSGVPQFPGDEEQVPFPRPIPRPGPGPGPGPRPGPIFPQPGGPGGGRGDTEFRRCLDAAAKGSASWVQYCSSLVPGLARECHGGTNRNETFKRNLCAFWWTT
jgi:hypothetical protein